MSLMTATAHIRKATARLREKDDFYRTPEASIRALLDVERFPYLVWEPACGDGAISKVLEAGMHKVISTDLVNRGFGEHGHDFLLNFDKFNGAIITNPPFKLADEFVLHALHIGATKVAMFQRIAWLEGQSRRRSLWLPHPPARIWMFSSRQTLWRGDENMPESDRPNGGAIAFAWFVWDSTHAMKGPPSLHWLP